MLRATSLGTLLVSVAGQSLSLVCSGISTGLPDRLTFFFLSRSPSTPVSGQIRLRDSSGFVFSQDISAVCDVNPPTGRSSDATVEDIAGWIRGSCGSVVGKTGPLLDLSTTTKITCYKTYPGMEPLDSAEHGGADGMSLHVVATGETDESSRPIPAVAAGQIMSIWAVAMDGVTPGWLGISQSMDPPAPMRPCPDSDVQPIPWMAIHPCSIGWTQRWVWFHVAPAGGQQDCVDPPQDHPSSCSNVPDGFMCPTACPYTTFPVGEVRCKDGKWSRKLKCELYYHACVAPLTTVTLSSPGNSGRSWEIMGVIPDGEGVCGLFTRLGAKCGATCSGGSFGTGQIHCKMSAGRGRYRPPMPHYEARPSFQCNPPSSDSLFGRPLITTMVQDLQTLRITAVVPYDPSIARSVIRTLYFREVSGEMTCSTQFGASTSSRTTAGDEPHDAEDTSGVVLRTQASLPDRRRLQGGPPDTCDLNEFTEQTEECLPGGSDGQCWNCIADELTTRDQCWRGRVGDKAGQNCPVLPLEGDFFTCRFSDFNASQRCYTSPPNGYCVKKICAYQDGIKSCTFFDPPTYGAFCVGDAAAANIDHAVIQYTCCDHSVITYTGYCSGGNANSIAEYEVMVGAKNAAGTSWSLPVSITCSELVLSGPDAEKYEIEPACLALLPGASCRVGCDQGKYIETRQGDQGVFTCQNGQNEQPWGVLPSCALKPAQRAIVVVGAQSATTTTTTSLPAVCAKCAELSKGWKNPAYKQCRAWGDPHIAKSWRRNRKFDHQGTGIFRYATSNLCAGNFEIQLFQCQYNRGRNAVATGVAAKLNNGDTVFISDRTIQHSGQPAVEPADQIHQDRAGVNVHSDDKCVFFNVNVKRFNGNPGFMHNLKILMFEEDLTAEGVCGAENLFNEYVDPTGGKMLFTDAQHLALCTQCVSSGGSVPLGCPGSVTPAPSPAPVPSTPVQTIKTPDCSWLAPLPVSVGQECTAADDPRHAVWKAKDGPNCVVYVYLGKKITCKDFCESKGSYCVTMVDDRRHDCEPKGTKELPCTTNYWDGICVCKIPAENFPGEDVQEACANSEDGMNWRDAESMCKNISALANAVYPPRSLEGTVTEEEDELDHMLQDCMTDACSSSPVDRAVIVENVETEVPNLATIACQFSDGLQYELGLADDAYPCNCGGTNCEAGEACLIVNNSVGSCAAVPTTVTVTTITDTETSTSGTSTSSTATTFTTSVTGTPTTRTSSTTSVTSTSLTTSSLTSSTSLTSSSTITSTSITSSTTATTTSSTSITTSLTSSTWTSSTRTSTSSTSLTSRTSTETSTTITTTSRTSTTTDTETTTSVTTSTTGTSLTTTSSSVTSMTRTWTGTTLTFTSSSSTVSTLTSSSSTATSSSSTETTVTSTSSTISSISTTHTKTSTTTMTSTSMTTTTTYPISQHCGPWNPVGAFAEISWTGGDFPSLDNDGNGWQWRVWLKAHDEGALWFMIGHCADIAETTCLVYCLSPGTTYDVRVELVKTIPQVEVLWTVLDVAVIPAMRPDAPEDLRVLTASSDSLQIAWRAAAEQGNCSFRFWSVEIKAPSGSWLVDPSACTGLTDITETSCTLTNLPCNTGYLIQAKEICEEEPSSDWSRPITASTLVGGSCADPAQHALDLNLAVVSSGAGEAAAGGRRLSTACPAQSYELLLNWQAGEQEDSQFLVWHVELYLLTIVAGEVLSEGVQIPDVCQGILNRATTSCSVPGLAFGLYNFAVQEISSMPATSSALSPRSNRVWVPRQRADTPLSVSLSAASTSSLRVSWVNAALKDCIFLRTKVEVSAGDSYSGPDWIEPEGCRLVTDFTVSSCVATGLQSNSPYLVRVSVLCDECLGTPNSQQEACGPADPEEDVCQVAGGSCFKKLQAFRSSSCTAIGASLSTLPRRQAAPTNPLVLPGDGGTRATFSWTAGQGSASDPQLPSDCASLRYQLEIKLRSTSDWGIPEGCADLTSLSCTALHLQCDTDYDARLRSTCALAEANSDWVAFPAWRTANAGSCLRPATAPQLLRAASVRTTSLELSFTAGLAGDCVFGGFELQMRASSETQWRTLPLDCGIRAGPSCLITELEEDTGYFFRARELCQNGSPLSSPWGSTQEALHTSRVPMIEAPSFLDPLGLVTGTPPTRLMLFFDTDLDFGDGSAGLSICPSPSDDDLGACECASPSDCASRCVSRDSVLATLMSSRVLLVDFSTPLPRPLTACPYNVVVEAGFLKTSLTPSKLSPAVAWSFTYSPPPPLGMVVLHSSTATSLTVHVSFDQPMTVLCGVELDGGVMHPSEPKDFTGARDFVEVIITGLTPFTQYTVLCTGSAIGDSILTSNVSTAGVSTLRDTDDSLSSITLDIKALCSDQSEQPVLAALYPPFDPARRQYQVTLNADEMRSWCGVTEVSARLRIVVLGSTTSAFAALELPEAESLVQLLVNSSGELPAGAARSSNLQVTLLVDPAQPGDFASVPYVIAFTLGILDIRVEDSSLPSILTFPNSGTLDISAPASFDASFLGLRLGPYEQTMTLLSSEDIPGSSPRRLYRFEVTNLYGLGSELALVIQARPPAGSIHPTLDLQTSLNVSSPEPIPTNFTTDFDDIISNSQPTLLTVSGTNLVVPLAGVDVYVEIYVTSIPVSCNTDECQERELQNRLQTSPNLCSETVVVEDGLACSVAPTASGRLGACLVSRRGFFAERYCAAFAPVGAVQPEQVAMAGVAPPSQEMSSSQPFVITTSGALPPESISQGFLQAWATPYDEPFDVTNPPVGAVPLCANAIPHPDANNSILCYRNQDWDVSMFGAEPNIFVQTGPDQTSSDLLVGALRVLDPEIITITRSHEYEVGEMLMRIEGRHFGTPANGNMVVSMEGLGAETPSLLRVQATDLGETSYITRCEILTHEDTLITARCITSEIETVLGSLVDSSFYEENVLPSSEGGRRLQQFDLDLLALQLSPLPVAIVVSYEMECAVLTRLGEPCGLRPENVSVPLARRWQAVRLKPCPAGEHRLNYTSSQCAQCQPGKYKSGVGPALSCSFCEKGYYMGLPGAGACTRCPIHETTVSTGATEITSCDCAPGYFRNENTTDWRLASSHGICQPCPEGAVCDGGWVLPYSADGYWTPDRLNFWPCFPPTACLQGDADDPNQCQVGRVATSSRCGQCDVGTYAHQSECHVCSTLDDVIAYMGVILWPALIVAVFIPLIIRNIRGSHMSRTKKSSRLFTRKDSWWSLLAGEDTGEFRMLLICWTSLQTLWIVSLMPLEYTSFQRSWLWGLGMTAFEMSIFRPQCAFRWSLQSYFMKWLMQWGLFFVMMAILCSVMFVYCHCHRNQTRDPKYISKKQGLLCTLAAGMMLLMLVHLRDDLIFVQCVRCEENKLCLAEQPVIYCAFEDSAWGTMAVLSILDLLFVILGSLPVIAISIYKSWKWQHGDLPGLSSDFMAPWYVFFSEDWVHRHMGYIKECREAVPEFEQAYRDLRVEGMRQEVWSKAIDIILAQEAEKAEIFSRRIIRHLYNHDPRYQVIDEDEGPTFSFVRSLVRSSPQEACPEEGEDTLNVGDVRHITIAMFNLVDFAKSTIPGARAIKRYLSYSWTFILLLVRYAIMIFAMLAPRDRAATVPLTYMITKLLTLVVEASLQPYQWSYLNDWEVTVHALIYAFMMFVVSGWSDVASNVLVVVATLAALIPVILRIIAVYHKDGHEDPTQISIKRGDSYNLGQLADAAAISPDPTRSMAPGTAAHIQKSIDLVRKKQMSSAYEEPTAEIDIGFNQAALEAVPTEGLVPLDPLQSTQVARLPEGAPPEPTTERSEDLVDVDEAVGKALNDNVLAV